MAFPNRPQFKVEKIDEIIDAVRDTLPEFDQDPNFKDNVKIQVSNEYDVDGAAVIMEYDENGIWGTKGYKIVRNNNIIDVQLDEDDWQDPLPLLNDNLIMNIISNKEYIVQEGGRKKRKRSTRRKSSRKNGKASRKNRKNSKSSRQNFYKYYK
jgi:hypothetical protein